MPIAQGNYGLPIILTLIDRKRQPIDLTGKTVTLRLKVNDDPVVEKVMAIVLPATDGIAQYIFEDGDLDISGTLQYEARIEVAGITVLTTDEVRREEIREVLV